MRVHADLGTVDGLARRLLRRRRRPHRPARAAFVAGDWGAVASLSPELFLRRVGDTVDVEPDQGHAAARRIAVGAARFGQGRRREHHDRRPGPQRPRPRRGHRFGHGARTAGGAPRARRVASGVDGVGPRRRRRARCPRCSTRRSRRRRSPERRRAGPASCWRRGSQSDAESIAGQSVWRHRSREPNSTSPSAPSSSTTRARAVLGVGGGITADSDPDARVAASACTRRRRSSGTSLPRRAAPRRRAHAVTARRDSRRSPRRTRP